MRKTRDTGTGGGKRRLAEESIPAAGGARGARRIDDWPGTGRERQVFAVTFIRLPRPRVIQPEATRSRERPSLRPCAGSLNLSTTWDEETGDERGPWTARSGRAGGRGRRLRRGGFRAADFLPSESTSCLFAGLTGESRQGCRTGRHPDHCFRPLCRRGVVPSACVHTVRPSEPLRRPAPACS